MKSINVLVGWYVRLFSFPKYMEGAELHHRNSVKTISLQEAAKELTKEIGENQISPREESAIINL